MGCCFGCLEKMGDRVEKKMDKQFEKRDSEFDRKFDQAQRNHDATRARMQQHNHANTTFRSVDRGNGVNIEF